MLLSSFKIKFDIKVQIFDSRGGVTCYDRLGTV